MSSRRGVIAWGILIACLRDSDYLSFGIALSIYAAVMHLISPAVEDGRLPSATWALIGALVGAGVLAGLTVVKWQEIQRIWSSHPLARPAVYSPAAGDAPAVCRPSFRDG